MKGQLTPTQPPVLMKMRLMHHLRGYNYPVLQLSRLFMWPGLQASCIHDHFWAQIMP